MDEIESKLKGKVLTDDQAMVLAIQEAKKGAGFVSPNPLVGCVVLDGENKFLGKGYHQKYGGPHAEVNAVTGLNYQILQGAKIYVTLEPCAHEGKTPSCAKLLAQLPIKEVIYGLVDPNPLVQGKGAKILQAAGINTRLYGKMQRELEEVCEHFLTNFRDNRPFVSVKVASSMDGQMALKSGESQWITGEQARQHGQFLRGSHDAVAVGKNTVLIDNPQLNLRHPLFTGKKEGLAVVFDREGECLQKSLQVFGLHKPDHLWIVVAKRKMKALEPLANGKATLIGVEETPLGVDLKEFLALAWDKGLRSILVEGGGQVISSLIAQNLVDRLYLFQAPVIIGAHAGHSWTQGFKIKTLSEGQAILNAKMESLGNDWLFTGRLRK